MEDHSTTPLLLAQFIASRICHDIISPIGAVNNGLELLSFSNQSQSSPEMNLVEQSAKAAKNKVELMRFAFGRQSKASHISPDDITDLLHQHFENTRTDINNTLIADINREIAQLIVLACLCFDKMLPLGGQIKLLAQDNKIHIRATSDRGINDNPFFNHLVENSSPEIHDTKPAEIQFLLLPLLSQINGYPLSAHKQGEETAIISLSI